MHAGTALVLFVPTLPDKPPAWWRQFDTLVAPAELASEAARRGLAFEAVEGFIDTQSIEEAAAFLGRLARAMLPDGTRVSKAVVYKGYELWWIHYDELFYRQCLPYTQYRRLLVRLAEFSSVSLHKPPATALFHAYLHAHGCRCAVLGARRAIPPIGIWLQAALSLLSWPFLLLTRPGILLYTGDYFDPPRDHSFRMRPLYGELRARKLIFVEFIRSLESSLTVLQHAMKRRRPVIYSHALKVIVSWAASLFGERTFDTQAWDHDTSFLLALSTMHVRNARGSIWSIRVLSGLIRSIGIRAALIPAASSRTYHEVLACKIASMPTIGILHGAASRLYNVYDFMPEYDGSKHLPLDRYGLWSEGWREYYLKYGAIYAAEHLHVSGPMRPLARAPISEPAKRPTGAPIRALLVPGELSDPEEIMPYLRRLMDAPGISLYLTFRPYRDAFETWIREREPKLLERLGAEKILLGNIHDVIAQCDVAVGCYSTGALEALLQLKPIVFFETRKWGDYFDLRSYADGAFFAKDPAELVERVRACEHISRENVKELQEHFFGDPHRNGSAWVVDQLESVLLNGYITR